MRISQEARAQANAVKEAVLRIRKQSLRNREEECFCSAHITRNSYAVWTEEKGDEAGSNQMLEQDDGNRRDSDQDETNQQSEQGGGDRDPGGHEKKAHDREVQHRICPEEGYQGETKPGESSHNDIGGKEGEQDKPAEVDKLNDYHPEKFERWPPARNWAEIIQFGRTILRQEIGGSPWSPGALSPETLPLVPGLLRLHDYSFLSVDSQPAELSLQEGAPQEWDDFRNDEEYGDSHRPGGEAHDMIPWAKVQTETSLELTKRGRKERWVLWQQRPYIELLLPRAEKEISSASVISFFLALQSHPAVVISVGALYPKGHSLGTTFDGPTHTVSRMKLTSSKETLDDAVWRTMTTVFTYSAGCGTDDEYAWFGESAAVRNAEPLVFQVAAKNWDNDLDLLGLLEKLVVEAGLKPVYGEVSSKVTMADVLLAYWAQGVAWVILLMIAGVARDLLVMVVDACVGQMSDWYHTG